MDQVVDGFDPAQGDLERLAVEHVGADHIDIGAPFDAVEPLGRAGQAADVVAGRQQLGHEAPADVAGRSDHGDLHEITITKYSRRRPADR